MELFVEVPRAARSLQATLDICQEVRLSQAMELLELPLIHGSIGTLKDTFRFTIISVTHY